MQHETIGLRDATRIAIGPILRAVASSAPRPSLAEARRGRGRIQTGAHDRRRTRTNARLELSAAALFHTLLTPLVEARHPVALFHRPAQILAMIDGPELIFDRRSVRLHRDRAATLVNEALPLFSALAERLLDRLDDTTRRFTRALDLGGRHGLVAEALRARGIPFVVCADLSPRMAGRAARSGPAVVADEEWLPFAASSFDLVVSCLSLHWVNDLPGALIQIRRVLVPDGLFLAVMPGLGTLGPLRQSLLEAELETTGGASPRVSPFADLADAAALLQRAGFALPVADGDTLTVTYDNPLALIRDLRALGETNALAQRSRRVPPRGLIASALARLPRDGEGRIALPLVLLTLTGWAPADSQPKPLRPGSAAARLADALGVVEHAAGDTAPLAPSRGGR